MRCLSTCAWVGVFARVVRVFARLMVQCRDCDRHRAVSRYPAIATGNWGCGAFGGDVQIKSVLQWLAASRFQRRLRYYSFGNDRCVVLGVSAPKWCCWTLLTREATSRVAGFAELVQELRARSLTVSDVWQQVCEYGMEVNTRRHDRRVTPRLFQFLRARLIDDRGSSGVDPPGTMVLDPPP